MKALILNSGLGTRMKGVRSCKCLMELADGISVFDAQVESLIRCGINEFIITTGSNADILMDHATEHFPNVKFIFAHNPEYAQTNYIYSIYLAREHLQNDDILLMHGDLVFEQNVLQDIIASPHSAMVTDSTKPLPEKDFKAVVRQGKIEYVGVNIPADSLSDAVYAQPLYKLLKRDWEVWLNEIVHFCETGKTEVYAENAFNIISESVNIFALDVLGRVCLEVDNIDDLEYAKDVYEQMPDRLQTIYAGRGSIKQLQNILSAIGAKKPFIVSDILKHTKNIDLVSIFSNAIHFDGFTPNPNILQVNSAINLFEEHDCDCIISFGGGSAIDVAKCVNMFKSGSSSELRDTPRCIHVAIPTTAGTGSESTCFAVAYKNEQKFSYEHNQMMPNYVILDPIFLDTLPLYQKKSTLLDALCQAIESLWAKGQTEKSRSYAASSTRIILEDIDKYFIETPTYSHSQEHNDIPLRILQAANLSGMAINISKTTAAHAMSYRLSSLFGLAHGHAAALCLKPVWKNIINSSLSLNFPLSIDYDSFVAICDKLDMGHNFNIVEDTVENIVCDLVSSVNTQRLGNHPIKLSEDVLTDMYYEILCEASDDKNGSN